MSAKVFDSHAHYDHGRFDEDRYELIGSLPEHGVDAVINIGSSFESSEASVRLAQQYPHFYAAVGIHPDSAAEMEGDWIARLEALTRHEKVVAIGEIGLDYYYDDCPPEIQKTVFEAQLELAARLDLPVIIHMREATQDTLNLLNRYHPRGVVHCYSSSWETAKQILALGMYISFTGLVTFHNVKKVVPVVENIPMDRFLLETDCPYMAPVPFRGKRCDSTMIPYSAAKIAELKGTTPDAVIEAAYENTCRLFGINRR